MTEQEYELRDVVAYKLVSWDHGNDHSWEGVAAMDADTLARLVQLAAKASAEDVAEFIEWASS
jgi:hypothetical protein